MTVALVCQKNFSAYKEYPLSKVGRITLFAASVLSIAYGAWSFYQGGMARPMHLIWSGVGIATLASSLCVKIVKKPQPLPKIVENAPVTDSVSVLGEKEWLSNEQWLRYVGNVIGQNPEKPLSLLLPHLTPESSMGPIGERFLTELKKGPVAAFFLINRSHVALIYIDPTKKTLEYYNGTDLYGNVEQIEKALQELASCVDCTYKKKITTTLQEDSYQCGVWALYFLKHRHLDSQTDFSHLKPENASPTSAQFRKEIRENLQVHNGLGSISIF